MKKLQNEVEGLTKDNLDALFVRPSKILGKWRSPSLGSDLATTYELLNITMEETINEIEAIYS